MKNNINYSTINVAEYNRINSLMLPLKTMYVEKDKVYYLEGLKYKDKVFFKCTKTGNVMIKYNYANGNDIFYIKGDGILKADNELTEGNGEEIKQ